MFGCVAMAGMLSVPEAIGAPIIAGYTAHADYKLNLPLLAVFVSAVLAGLIMTVLTWLVLAVRNVLGKKQLAGGNHSGSGNRSRCGRRRARPKAGRVRLEPGGPASDAIEQT